MPIKNNREQQLTLYIKSCLPVVVTRSPFSGSLADVLSVNDHQECSILTKRNKKTKIEGWEDMNKYRVAVIIGNKTMEVRLKQFVLEENIIAVSSYEQAFKMLQLHRLDVVVGKTSVGVQFIRKNKNIHMKGKFEYHDLYMYLHKKHKNIIPIIESELKKLKVDGTLEKINQKVLADLMK